MKRLAVIPSDPISEYLSKGYSPRWLEDYYNPGKFFDEVYLLSDLEKDEKNLLGMKVIHTRGRDFSRKIKELKIDVVRAYGGNWACAVACEHKVSNVPVIVSVHDSSPNKLYDSIKKADVVFCVSDVVKKLVATKFNNSDRLWLLPNRVDFNSMRPYPKDQTQDLTVQFPFKYKIIHVGRLSHEKNLDTLIKALAILGSEYCVIAVGQGNKAVYEQIAHQFGVHSQVFFMDSVPHDELARYFSFADCMCTPSRWEGFGMVFIEALACEAVVVTSDIAPMNEYITDRQNGLLVKAYEDPNALATTIKSACLDEGLRSRIKSRARQSVLRFEKKTIESKEIEFYQRALSMKTTHKKDLVLSRAYHDALQWIKEHSVPEQGVMVSSQKRVPYLEVTGYLIPTLIDAGEINLARTYAEFLAYMQRPDGGFCGPDGKSYVFDSAQALRGLLAAAGIWEEFKAPALKAAEYLFRHIETTGRVHFYYHGDIPQYVQLYSLPALNDAGRFFNRPDFLDAVRRSVSYYKEQKDMLDASYLTHFLAYTLDGLIDLGESDFVRPFVEKLFLSQAKDGRIPAFHGKDWVCSVGLAQLAIVAYKLGMGEQGDKALKYLCSVQNPSGGFYGSYGFKAKYFPKAEISWANKFFLDAVYLKNKHQHVQVVDHKEDQLLNEEQWHRAITAGATVEELTAKIRANDFPVWIRPLLEHTQAGEVVLEMGSGTGEMSAICGVYGRSMKLVDFSKESLDFAKQLFQELSLSAQFHCLDIQKPLPMDDGSVDWVFSSGVLEHFKDEEIIHILKDSKRLSRRGVISLVPNANALLYRIGKSKMEREGRWLYGHEEPRISMRPLFEAAGFHAVKEYSIGAFHTLKFWGHKDRDIQLFLRSLSRDELAGLNQGYLLVTIGMVHGG